MSIRTNAYYELLDAMKEKGCPLCFLLDAYIRHIGIPVDFV